MDVSGGVGVGEDCCVVGCWRRAVHGLGGFDGFDEFLVGFIV